MHIQLDKPIVEVNFQYTDSRKMIISGQLIDIYNDKKYPVKILYDTGSSRTLVDKKLIQIIFKGQEIPYENKDIAIYSLNGRSIEARLFKMDTLSLGAVKFSYFDLAECESLKKDTKYDMILGMDLLENFQVEQIINLDTNTGVLKIKQNQTSKARFQA